MLLRHAARNTARAFSSTAIPATSVATLHELGVAAGDVYSDQKSLGAKERFIRRVDLDVVRRTQRAGPKFGEGPRPEVYRKRR